jgi:hypothetical protein
MAEEKVFNGVRSGDTWLAKGPITRPQAEEFIDKHLRGAGKDSNWDLEEEGDHLVMILSDRDEPQSNGYPGSNGFAKDQTWGSVGKARSGKRTEYPRP